MSATTTAVRACCRQTRYAPGDAVWHDRGAIAATVETVAVEPDSSGHLTLQVSEVHGGLRLPLHACDVHTKRR